MDGNWSDICGSMPTGGKVNGEMNGWMDKTLTEEDPLGMFSLRLLKAAEGRPASQTLMPPKGPLSCSHPADERPVP